MRLNRLSLIFALPCALLLPLSCERADVLTDAGGSVIVGDDPAQAVGPWRGFARVTLDSLYNHQGCGETVDSAFSLPAKGDPLFGTDTGSMLIGVSDEHDTLAAHVQYVTTGRGYKNSTLDTTIKFVEAYIYFQSTETSDTIVLRDSKPLSEKFAPVDKVFDGGSPKIGKLLLNSADSGGSVKLTAGDFYKDIVDIFDGDSIYDRMDIAFSIVDYHGKILNLGTPYVVVTTRWKYRIEDKDNAGSMKDTAINVNDTIRGSARYTAFESADDVADRAAKPYSSQYTRRTAVFRINLKDVFEELSDTTKKKIWLPADAVAVMNAVFAVKPNNSASKKAGTYTALILDELLSEEIKKDPSNADTSRLLRYKFEKATSAGIKEPYSTHGFAAVLRDIVEEYNIQSAKGNNSYKPYIYVYLRPVTEGSVIEWNKDNNCANCGPQKVETVFTHSR